ncbi:hypothetical protein B0H66DRAFT_537566 [Apodospora peruviana]|uniref:Uncharacterized protein n=1 Tax=Apodospora peruviana TaxID=516989 RepID=A0AAE0HWV1_9PEZI|nr:hypothetical protein B0H66DRAFT_537566 [Apodospora peruviana]
MSGSSRIIQRHHATRVNSIKDFTNIFASHISSGPNSSQQSSNLAQTQAHKSFGNPNQSPRKSQSQRSPSYNQKRASGTCIGIIHQQPYKPNDEDIDMDNPPRPCPHSPFRQQANHALSTLYTTRDKLASLSAHLAKSLDNTTNYEQQFAKTEFRSPDIDQICAFFGPLFAAVHMSIAHLCTYLSGGEQAANNLLGMEHWPSDSEIQFVKTVDNICNAYEPIVHLEKAMDATIFSPRSMRAVVWKGYVEALVTWRDFVARHMGGLCNLCTAQG